MTKHVYLCLGSGSAQQVKVGNKAALLDQAARRGLSVPLGVIVLDTAWDQAVLLGLIAIDGERVRVIDEVGLVRFLGLPDLGAQVAVRSAFAIEDRHDQSLAGYFESVLHVPSDHPQKLGAAIAQVLSSATRMQSTTVELPAVSLGGSAPRAMGFFRRDMLIMSMVNAQMAGVAFTEREFEDDLINYTAGTGDRLVQGKVAGEAISLPKLWDWESVAIDTWQGRLQHLLREVRRHFGRGDWDVEWADDGSQCYLLQLRPITRAPRRNELFTIANHKEILPPLPSVFMTSIVESCAADLFAYYRQFDPSLPQQRPFIEVFYGRPYINLSLLSEMMRVFGLPTRLVTDNIGGGADTAFPINRRRMLIKIVQGVLPRFALAQALAVGHADQAGRELLRRTESPGTTLNELIETLRWLYGRLVTEMFSLTALIGPLLSLLRHLGVLDEHSTRSTTRSTALDPLRALTDPKITEALQRGEIPDHAEFKRHWARYMEELGHRGIYESDISRPRYREDPRPLLALIMERPHPRPRPVRRTWRGWITLPLWWQAYRAIQAREQWRDRVMIGFERVRMALLREARRLADQGVLPTPDHLWHLRIGEVRQLETGWQPDAIFWESRLREIERLKGYRLPDLFRRFDDLDRESTPKVTEHRFSGVSLTRGEITGRAWVLDEPSLTPPEGWTRENTILIARSVDAGWLPTFSKVSGVVVETGGDLSHGSILLREIGLPAITNVSAITAYVQTGDPVRLHADRGVVERV
ncbi:MAG: PEP-utilizing enzyme [Anaerolineae bacterium]|jgi:pyruvate,water dikinase|nr:PEP-utilizing enzyme [Anaerolineae bacterium]